MAHAGKDLAIGECVMLEKVDADRLVSFGSAEYVHDELVSFALSYVSAHNVQISKELEQKEEKQGYQTKEEKQVKKRKSKTK